MSSTIILYSANEQWLNDPLARHYLNSLKDSLEQKCGLRASISDSSALWPESKVVAHVFGLSPYKRVLLAIEDCRRNLCSSIVAPIREDQVARFIERKVKSFVADFYNSEDFLYNLKQLQDEAARVKPDPEKADMDFLEILSKAWSLGCASQAQAEDLSAYGNFLSTCILPLGMNLKPFTDAPANVFIDKYGISGFIFCPGPAGPLGNQIMGALAAAKLNMPLVFTGEPSDQAYSELLRRIAPRQTLFIPKEDLGAGLIGSACKAASVCLLPSLGRDVSLYSLAAAASGCPLLLSGTRGNREYFEDEARYVNPADLESICAAIEEITHTDQSGYRHALSLYASEHFAIDDCVETYAQAYSKAKDGFLALESMPEDGPIYIDLSHSAQRSGPPDGIPRLEIRYAQRLYNAMPERVRFVAWNYSHKLFVPVSYQEFSDGTYKTQAGQNSDPANISPELWRPFGRVEFEENASLVAFGALWMAQPDYIQALAAVALKFRIRLNLYIADIIPIKFPHYFKGKVDHIVQNLGEYLRVASRILVYSEQTRKDIRELAIREDFSCPPISIVRLGDMPLEGEKLGQPDLARVKALIGGRPFVLYVSGNDFRKNHVLLHAIWRQLALEYEPDEIPCLLCVGPKRLNNQSLEIMGLDPLLEGNYFYLHDVDDSTLDRLYRMALFTVYPSLYEGWGLPVAESLGYGKICVASDAASIPEIAPGFVDMINPTDYNAWYDRICTYIFSAENRAAREAEIKNYPIVSWAESAQRLVSAIAKPSLPKEMEILATNTTYHPGQKGTFILAGGWEQPEKSGIWSNGSRSFLKFALLMGKTPKKLVLIAHAYENPAREKVAVDVIVNGKLLDMWLIGKAAKTLTTLIPAQPQTEGAFSEVNIAFDIINPRVPANIDPESTDKRLLGFMIHALRIEECTPEDMKLLAILDGLDKLTPGLSSYFQQILQTRPDVRKGLPEEKDRAIWWLFFWAWQFGSREERLLAYARPVMLETIRSLLAQKDENGLSVLIRCFQASFDELSGLNISDSKIAQAMQKSFMGTGLKRLGLAQTSSGEIVEIDQDQSGFVSHSLAADHRNRNTHTKHKDSVSSLTMEAMGRIFGFHKLEVFSGPEPTLRYPVSQLPTYSQFLEPEYQFWCSEFKQAPREHRKQWEHVYCMAALRKAGMLRPGMRGVGFGCGKEPLASVMAKYGCMVTTSDYPQEVSSWNQTGQQSFDLRDLWHEQAVDWETFKSRVEFRPVDMNNIPTDFYGQYDFAYSSCALEHIGSISHGLNFIINSMKCLKPGGYAIHTTELNLSDTVGTLESPGLSFFRKSDIEKLLQFRHFQVIPINWSLGHRPEDDLVDFYPFNGLPHIRLSVMGRVITSIGLIIRKL